MVITNQKNVNTIAWAKPHSLVCNVKISPSFSLFAVSLGTETDPKFSAIPNPCICPVSFPSSVSSFFYSFSHIFFICINP